MATRQFIVEIETPLEGDYNYLIAVSRHNEIVGYITAPLMPALDQLKEVIRKVIEDEQ